MTDHYAVAERLLTPARYWYGGHAEETEVPPGESDIERAKAHATLALVAEMRRMGRAE